MPKKNSGQIMSVQAREILDSRGYPTIEATVILESGLKASASAPAGIEPDKGALKDLRDGDRKRYFGKGVLLAANHINEIISPRLKGMEVTQQQEIDRLLIELDGSQDRRQLGANAIYTVSIAVARAAAAYQDIELHSYIRQSYKLPEPPFFPVPMFNMFNGGRHADTNLDFQEFLLIPQKGSTAFTAGPREGELAKMIRAGAEVYHLLGKVLRESGFDTDTGLEGGYAPDMDSSLKALEMIMAAIIRAGYRPGEDFKLGIDIGSAELFDQTAGQYIFPLDEANLNPQSLSSLYSEWLARYPLAYLEDGAGDDDWPAWREATSALGDKLILAGDDLFAGSIERLRRGIAERAANAIVLKPNQAGTLTETIECAKLAQRQNYRLIISHRGSETNDDFISDLSAALGAHYLKAGSLSRGERVSKYNRLAEIALANK